MGCTFVQPNFETQSGIDYKGAIDGAIEVLARIGAMFAPHEQDTPDMTVRLDAGAILLNAIKSEIAGQSTDMITAPTGTDQRIDRVVVDALTGIVSVITGTPGSNPSAPDLLTGKLPICQIALAHDTTVITNDLMTDERVSSGGGGEAWPVGGIYPNLGADPATQLGYGTWVFMGFNPSPSFSSLFPPAQSDTYVKATSTHTGSHPYNATDPNNPLTGNEGYSWLNNGGIADQRFHVDLGVARLINGFRYDNHHNSGVNTNQGAKDFTFWGSNSNAAFAELTYGIDDDWTQLPCDISQLVQHVAADQADPHYVVVTNTTPYRYYAFKFASNWGASAYINLRRIELQSAISLWLRVGDLIQFSTIPLAAGITEISQYDDSLAQAVATIGVGIKTLLVNKNITLNVDLVMPEHIQLWVNRAGRITVDGCRLTILCSAPGGVTHIFNCINGGEVRFGDATHPPLTKELPVEWWGATANGSLNNSTAVDAAIVASISSPAIGGAYPKIPVSFLSGTYAIETCLNGAEKAGVYLKGASSSIQRGTVLLGKTGAGKAIIDISGSPGARIEGISLQRDTSTIGIITGFTTVDGCNGQIFRDVAIYFTSSPTANNNLGTIGIVGKSAENITFDHVNIYADNPIILSRITNLDWITSGGANTYLISSDFVTFGTMSQGVVTFVGDCSLVGYHTRPNLSIYDANTIHLGNTYMGAIGAATATYAAVLVGGTCSTFTWNGHAENFNTLMDIPGNIINAQINAQMTPITTVNPILNMNPAVPGVFGGGLSNSKVSVCLPPGAAPGCFISSTDTAHPSFIDNVVLSAWPWVKDDITTIRPNVHLLPLTRNVRVELLGGSYNYFGTNIWIPVIAGSIDAGVGTYTIQVGGYNKVDNRVTVWGTIVWSAHTGTGNIIISGLPFASSAIASLYPVGSITPTTLIYTKTSVFIFMPAGGTQVLLYERNFGDALSNVAINATGGLVFNISYLVD